MPKLAAFALAGLVLLPAAPVAAEAKKPPAAKRAVDPGAEKQLITMDFQDVEIGVLVKFISEITGKNFILDEKVRGKVTVVSPTKITIDEAYRVFQSILEVKGFTTVPSGPTTKIVPLREAKESGAPLTGRIAPGDEFITQLVPLSFVEPSTLVPVLQPMVSKDGLISAYDPANTIILIDCGSNIERILSVISELDIEVPERGIEVIPLKHAWAQTVAATLSEVLEAQREQGKGGAPAGRAPGQPAVPAPGAGAPTVGAFKVLPDERTNSVIALAGPAQMRTIKALAQQLDKSLEGVSKINVYPLKYANATEMVQTLSELISGGGGGGGGLGRGGLGGLGSGAGNTRRQTRQQLQQAQFARSSRGGRGPGGGQLGQQLGALGGGAGGQAAGQQGATSAQGGGGEFVGEVRVTADPYTNSLIISAGPQDYDVLKRVVAELDVPRRQVFVEAIILEVSLDRSRQLGLESQGGIPLNDQGLGIGRLNLNNLNTALAAPQALSGLVLAAASNQTITLPDGSTVPAQLALFTALQSDTDVNILSAPTILTSDNQEAEILVGQNIPFIASRATNETNLANTFATVERQDVGITLRLTPQISQGGTVRLDIYEEVSAVVPNPPVDPDVAGPTTTVRSTSTTIVARDGQTVALGGLISDNVSAAESKIPYIGDIPVLGNLFKFTDARKNKINLLIFLTPHIVRDDMDLQSVSIEQRDKFRRYLQAQKAGPRRHDQLDAPSWDQAAIGRPSAPLLVPPPPSGMPSTGPYAEPPPPPTELRIVPGPPPPPPPPTAVRPSGVPPPPPPLPRSAAALGIPTVGHRFAVLLSLYEKGEPPPELQATNGFLTVYMPESAGEFFVKGGNYEYTSSRYEAKYTCLEVFPDGNQALAVYPEGRALERWGGAVVRWKPISADQLRLMIAGTSPWKRTK